MADINRRVAHLSTVHSSRDNRIFHKECRALQEAGEDIWLIIPQQRHETADGVKIHSLTPRGSRLKRVVLGQVDAWRALNCVKPALVHAHDPELIPLVVLWKTIHRRKAVYDAHEDLEKQIDGKPYLPRWARATARVLARTLVDVADRATDGIVAATPSIARRFRNKNTIVVHNYPWLSEYPGASDRKPEPGTIVYVGGMSEGRGFSLMVSAVQQIAGARLLLAGSMDGDVSEKFAGLPDDSDVEYVGQLSARAVPEVLGRAALGLVLLQPLPNYVESLPTKLFEYMASGIPFVASDFPYWRRLLEDFDCGVFVDENNNQACVDAIEELILDPEHCTDLGQRGRAAVLERFNFDREAGHLVTFTQSLIGAAGEPIEQQFQSSAPDRRGAS